MDSTGGVGQGPSSLPSSSGGGGQGSLNQGSSTQPFFIFCFFNFTLAFAMLQAGQKIN